MIREKLGKYTLLETIGGGSLGTIYRADDLEDHPVALRLVQSQVLSSVEKLERFLQCAPVASEICPAGIPMPLDQLKLIRKRAAMQMSQPHARIEIRNRLSRKFLRGTSSQD